MAGRRHVAYRTSNQNAIAQGELNAEVSDAVARNEAASAIGRKKDRTRAR
jgi:hypothetical protein